MTSVVFLAAVAAAGAGLVAWFCQLEQAGRAATVVAVVWAVVVVDALVYPGLDSPAGLFHPKAGNLRFRLPELLIVAALGARLIARGLPRRVEPKLLWWAAFCTWYATAGLFGLLLGHSLELVLFEVKAVIYVGGGLLLAAGVPAVDYLASRAFRRLVGWSAAGAVAILLTDQLGVRVEAHVPVVPLQRFGEMGTDAGTVLATLGLIAFALSAVTRRHAALLLVAAPLLAAPLVTRQRAGLLALGLGVLVLAAGWISHGRRRFELTPTELAMVGMAMLFLLLAPVVGTAAARPEEPPPANPFAEEIRTAFTSPAKAQSAQSRRYQWIEGRRMVGDHPVMGNGLGTEYWVFEVGPDEFWRLNMTHNVLLDVAVRSGLVGLLLLLVAVGTSLLDGLRSFLRHPDPRVAALGLACAGGIVGLIGRGLVESIFEKYLIATTLGLLLGVLRSTAASVGDPTTADAAALEEAAWS